MKTLERSFLSRKQWIRILLVLALVTVLIILWQHDRLGRTQQKILITLVTKSNRQWHKTADVSNQPPRNMSCGSLHKAFKSPIPFIVHWVSKDSMVPEKSAKLMRTWHSLLGNQAIYMHWDDNRLLELVKRWYPQLLGLFQHELVTGLERSDIGRLLVVHHVGGIYADTDVELLRSPAELLKNFSRLWTQEPWEHILFMYKRDRLISNAMFMSRPGDPFLTWFIESWPKWFRAKWAGRRSLRISDPSKAADSTGPLALNELLNEYEKTHKDTDPMLADPDWFQPVWDPSYAPDKVVRGCRAPKGERAVQLCNVHRQLQFKGRPVPASAYAVHRFLHFGVNKNIKQTVPIHSLAPLTQCTI